MERFFAFIVCNKIRSYLHALGVKLIDYTFYTFGLRIKKALEITHGQVMAIMNQAVPQDNVKEDLSSLEVWTFLKKQPITTPALLVLYSRNT